MNIIRFLLLMCSATLLIDQSAGAQPIDDLDALEVVLPKKADPIRRFYELNDNKLFWFCDSCSGKRNALLNCLQNAEAYGFKASSYPLGRSPIASNTSDFAQADNAITSMAFAFCKDLYCGADIKKWVSYDGVSQKYEEADNDFLVKALSACTDSAAIVALINRLEPQCPQYRALKDALNSDSSSTKSLRRSQLNSSLNYYRWVHHFALDSYIVINISATTLRYYKNDSSVLNMRAVVGTPHNRTPRFAAYAKEVTLYPYWNMPRSILVNEWLHSFRRNPGLVSLLNMEVIDRKGRVVPSSAINRNTFTTGNFPYRVRQKPGCLNPMGVIKFALTSPYDVYLHDTNFKGAFLSHSRYYSHGCIRIEEPIALADAVLVNKVDADFLKACYKDQQPQVIPLANPIPVFVVYMCAEGNEDGSVQYYTDVYGLLK